MPINIKLEISCFRVEFLVYLDELRSQIRSEQSYTGGVCWACSKGCAALSVLALKGLDPNKDNITYHLNDNADVIWSKAGYKKQESKIPSSFPCIAKLSNRQHYVILTGNADNKGYNAWDPSGGKVKTFDSKQIGPIFA
ncbi:unnamed protein product [Rotaria magnacalcarata]